MSIALRSFTASTNNQVTSFDSGLGLYYISLAAPAGLAVGDLMVTVAVAQTYGFPPVPAGWTAKSHSYTGDVVQICWKIATAADVAAGAMRLGYSTASRVVTAMWAAYSGGAKTVTYTQGSDKSGSGTLTSPAVSPTGGQVGLFAFTGLSGAGTGLVSPPSRGTVRVNLAHAASTYELLLADVASGSGASAATVSGGAHEVALLVLNPNQAPNTPVWTSPASGSTVAGVDPSTFTWSFSDPDPGDSQADADIRYSSDGGSTWTTVTSAASTVSSWTAAGGTFTIDGPYQIQVKTYDGSGAASGWSASLNFTVVAEPAAPVITDPVGGATVGFRHTVIWTATDQAAYEARVVADLAGSPDPTTVYDTTGLVTSVAARSADLTFPVTGVAAHVQVRVQYLGVFSDWADAAVTVAWIPPETPALTITTSDNDAAIEVDIVTVLDSLPSDAVGVNLYASPDDGVTVEWDQLGLAPTSTAVFYTPAKLRDYSFQAVAYAADGTVAATAWTGSASHTSSDIRTIFVRAGGAPAS